MAREVIDPPLRRGIGHVMGDAVESLGGLLLVADAAPELPDQEGEHRALLARYAIVARQCPLELPRRLAQGLKPDRRVAGGVQSP